MKSILSGSDARSGFSLITLSIMLTAAAIVAVSVLPGQRPGESSMKARTVVTKLEKIEKATTSFMALNGRRPCPADGSLDVNNVNFGKEVANPGTCTGTSGTLGPDSTGYIVGGIIPTKALGLPDDYAFDDWGHRIQYVVDKRATLGSSCSTLQNSPTNNGKGGILIENTTNGTVLDNVMAAYISAGADGFGAFPAQGSSATGRINNGSTDTDELTNAGVNSSFSANFTDIKVQKAKTATFDDIVYYAQYQKNICTVLGTGGSSSCTPTANEGGGTLAVLGARTEYTNQSDGTCTAHTMTCNAGSPPTLSCSTGSMSDCAYSSCNMSCGLSGSQGGGSMTSGAPALTEYTNASDGTCTAHTMTCTNGTLACSTGNMADCQNSACTLQCTESANQGSGTLNGSGPGNTATEFTSQSDGSCTSHTMTCTNGSLSCSTGSMTDCQYNSCNLDCGLTGNQGGGVLLSGNSKPEFTNASDGTCTSHSLTCTNGTPSCSTGNMADCTYSSCALSCSESVNQGGGTLNGSSPGNTQTEYASNSAPSCPANTMTCTNGTLTCSTGAMSGCGYNSCSVVGGGGLSGFRMDGATAGDGAGTSVAYGDINGDGIPDLVIGVESAGYNGKAFSGSVYVIYGTKSGFADPLPLSTLNGTNGFRIDGATAGDQIGFPVTVGDINGDGYADIIISAQTAGYNGKSKSGSVYVVYGGPTGKMKDTFTSWAATNQLSALLPIGGSDGFRLDGGAANDYLGAALATGDINGDGYADMIIGASGASYGKAQGGAVYVIYGTNVQLPLLANINIINGSKTFTSVSTVGLSVNQSLSAPCIPVGTTISSIVGTTITMSNAGNCSVAGTGVKIYTSTLANGNYPINATNGFRLDGATAGDRIGSAVASGDINADGYSDIIFGAPLAGSGAGWVYTVLGGATGKMEDGTSWAASQLLSAAKPINGTDGFRLAGATVGDGIGEALTMGDINGDGYADMVIGAYTSYSAASAGSVYVIYGGPTGKMKDTFTSWAATQSLSAAMPINGTDGFRLDGAAASDNLGWSVAVGDINRDGYGDLIMGAPGPLGMGNAGKVYVVYGATCEQTCGGGWSGIGSLTTGGAFINGTHGFLLSDSTAGDQAGNAVAVGDIHGNGYPDITIGASGASPHGSGSGSVYVVDGQSCSYAATNTLGTVVTSPSVCSPDAAVPTSTVIQGAAAGNRTGFGVASADINGDGIPDLIISAFAASYWGAGTGSVYVVFGNKAGFPDPLPLSMLDGTNGFRLDGATASDWTGWSVTAGDINGDGVADIVIGTPYASYNGLSNSGSVYVVYGGATMKDGVTAWTSCPCRLTSGGPVINATNGFRIDGAAANDHTGYSIAVGDFNGDSHSDLLIGAPSTGAGAGLAYVIYSGGSGKMLDGTAWLANQQLASGTKPIDGTNGFLLTGQTAGDNLGWEVAAGDINGDGKTDMILTAYLAGYNSNANSGSVYVIYGGASGKWLDGTAVAANNTLTGFIKPIDGANGFRLDGATASDELGRGLAVGDFNGDGKADIIIGAYHASYGAATSGSVYVVYGGASGQMFDGTPWSATNLLTSGIAPINGTDGIRFDGPTAGENDGDYNSIATGDINSDGYADIIIGADSASYNGKASSGSAYIVLGGPTMKDGAPWGPTNTLAAAAIPTRVINGVSGFRLDGPTAGFNLGTGDVVANVTGYTYPEIVLGSWPSTHLGALTGSVYVYPGHASPWATTYSLGLICPGC